MLALKTDGFGPVVVMLHGFTQDASSWDPVVERLGEDRLLVRPDLPGHGASGHEDATIDEAARLVHQACGRGVYIGYSMGARIALNLAIQQPHAVTRLVLVGVNPGLQDPAERAARIESDERWATMLETEGMSAFIEAWLAQPMFSKLHHGAESRRRNNPRYLAASLRRAGTGSMAPMWDRLGDIDVAVDLITGAEDAKFLAIAEQMRPLLKHGRVHTIAEAGHAAHLEQPEAFAAHLGSLLNEDSSEH